VPTARTCLVSFTDSENIGHSVEVVASTLYEAAVLAIAQFRSCVHVEMRLDRDAANRCDQTAEHDARGAVGEGRSVASR
jgi:hypothetical protein